jgi:hypothetical protein
MLSSEVEVVCQVNFKLSKVECIVAVAVVVRFRVEESWAGSNIHNLKNTSDSANIRLSKFPPLG